MPQRRGAAIIGGVLCLLAPAAFGAPKSAVPAKAPSPASQAAIKAPVTLAPAAKPAPVKKSAAKSRKKKQVAKGKLKSGRAAASAASVPSFDATQIAVDRLTGAAARSPLDLLVSYKETLTDGDLETAGVLLRLAAGRTPDHSLVTVVNDLIGAGLNTDDTQILIDIARAERAAAVANIAPANAPSAPASSVGARIQSAHTATATAPGPARIEALIAYKVAVIERNAEGAALALATIAQATPDEAAVRKANALLGLGDHIPAAHIVAASATSRSVQ